MVEFLKHFKQAGALPPTRLEKMALRQGERQEEMQVLEMGKEYLKRVGGVEDYQAYRKHMVERLGMNPDILPESFDDEAKFEDWRTRTISTADAYLMYKQGKPFDVTVYGEGGATYTTKMPRKDYETLKEKGYNVELGKQSKPSYEEEEKREEAKVSGREKAELEATASYKSIDTFVDSLPGKKQPRAILTKKMLSMGISAEDAKAVTDAIWSDEAHDLDWAKETIAVMAEDVKKEKRSKKPLVEVYTGDKAKQAITKKAGEEVGKGIGSRINERITGASESINQNYQLDIVEKAIKEGAGTGIGEETLLNIKSLAETMGVDVGDLSGQEIIRKVSNEMALRLRNPDSGLGLTGNTSNKDLDFLKASVVGLGRTERGNLRIIAAMKKYNQFRIDMSKEQQRLIDENKGIPTDIDSKLLDWANNYNFFDDEEIVELKRLSQKIIKRGKTKDGRDIILFEDGTKEYAN